MEADSQAPDTLPMIPEDSAESQPESPLPAHLRVTPKSPETVPDSVSSISTRRSSLRSPLDFPYAQFEGLAERVSERVDKQNCSCACHVF